VKLRDRFAQRKVTLFLAAGGTKKNEKKRKEKNGKKVRGDFNFHSNEEKPHPEVLDGSSASTPSRGCTRTRSQ
jgi:hypothetical protein